MAEGGTIYIGADGSIDPPTAPIQRNGDIYTLTSDIESGDAYDAVVILRNNMILDGAGHTVQGTGNGGIYLSGRSNVTIKNMEIKGFGYGILFLNGTYNGVFGNNITANTYAGIGLYSSEYNSIYGNNITNNPIGIYLIFSSSYNDIFGNDITGNNWFGIQFVYSSNYNSVFGNNITANYYAGIKFDESSQSKFYHNNFANSRQVIIATPYAQLWDDGYPSGGNYWSDYVGVDEKRGSDQNVMGSDGIGDTPYVIDANNQDRYPLMGYLDSDGDGLYNQWERYGIDMNGDGTVDLDLPALGADWRYKDLFIEIDYMGPNATAPAPPPHDHNPDPDAINDVKNAFRNAPVDNPNGTQGIALHIEVDEPILHHDIMNVWDDFDSNKTNYFGTPTQRSDPNSVNILAAKRLVYRYALFIHQFARWNGTHWVARDSSGIAETSGNDFIVSLGAFENSNGTRDQQAGTLMHEFGHTLGLRHGGGDDINGKPNYLSIMSYCRQFTYFIHNRPLDYSRAKLPTLDESNLNESLGIQGPANDATVYGPLDWNATSDKWEGFVKPSDGPIDWNRNGIIEGSVERNINDFRPVFEGLQDDTLEVLEGYDDWANLSYNFRGTPDFADGAHMNVADQEITWEIVEQMRNTTIIGFHDIACTNVTSSKTVVGVGHLVSINTTVVNLGYYTETFNVTLYANVTSIASQTVSLTIGNSTTITFTWNTTGFAYGNYTISAYAQPVSGETDTADNAYEDGWVLVSCVGDVNGDKKTTISDIVLVIGKFGTTPSSPEWNPNMDIDGNDKVTIGDIVITINNFGNIWT